MAQKGSTPLCSARMMLACLLLAFEGSMCVPPRPGGRISQREWKGVALAGMRGGGGTIRIGPEDDGMPMRNGGAWATAYSDRLDSDSLSDGNSGDWDWDSVEGSEMGVGAEKGASGGGFGPSKGLRRSALLDEGAMTQVTPGMAGLRERKREADPKKRGNQTARKLVGEAVRLATSGDLSTAAERLSSAISLAPDLAEAHANLASVRLQMGEVDEAISGYMEAKRLDPKLQEARYNLATALHGLALRARAAEGEWGELAFARWSEAEAEYLEALAMRETADAHFNLANLYAERHGACDEQAEEHYRASISMEESADAMVNYGILQHRRGIVQQAQDLFEAAAERDPGCEAARTNRARSLVELGHAGLAAGDWEGAGKYYREALRAAPAAGDVCVVASVCVFLNGGGEDAASVISRAAGGGMDRAIGMWAMGGDVEGRDGQDGGLALEAQGVLERSGGVVLGPVGKALVGQSWRFGPWVDVCTQGYLVRNMEDEEEPSDGQVRGLVMPPEGHVLLLHADMEVGQLEHKLEAASHIGGDWLLYPSRGFESCGAFYEGRPPRLISSPLSSRDVGRGLRGGEEYVLRRVPDGPVQEAGGRRLFLDVFVMPAGGGYVWNQGVVWVCADSQGVESHVPTGSDVQVCLASEMLPTDWLKAGMDAAKAVLKCADVGGECGPGIQVLSLRLQPLEGGSYMFLGAGPGIPLGALESALRYGRTEEDNSVGAWSGDVGIGVRDMVNKAMCLSLFGLEPRGGEGEKSARWCRLDSVDSQCAEKETCHDNPVIPVSEGTEAVTHPVAPVRDQWSRVMSQYDI